MVTIKTENIRINELRPLISPAVMKEECPTTATAVDTVVAAREAAANIIQGLDDRLLVVIGPCSIHDPKAALEYAHLLKQAHDKYQDSLFIVMRIYFEKPRTTVGWKGMINDPGLDGTFDVNRGLRLSRKLLLDINNLKLPAATEFLDSIVPQYLCDLISWGAIGARTSESQLHRELASGLSMPIGFKNGTRGDLQIAIDGVDVANHPHHFLSVTKQGLGAIVSTKGNEHCHIILRGSEQGTNYHTEDIQDAKKMLSQRGLNPMLMVDCSHGNSNKDHQQQKIVAKELCQQIAEGERGICGVMLESNLEAGQQSLSEDGTLRYGQSITDACLSWEDSLAMLKLFAQAVESRRLKGTS